MNGLLPWKGTTMSATMVQNITRHSAMTENLEPMRSLKVAGSILRQKSQELVPWSRRQIDALPNFFEGSATLLFNGCHGGLVSVDHYKKLIVLLFGASGTYHFPDNFSYNDVLPAIILCASVDFDALLNNVESLDIHLFEFQAMMERWQKNDFIRSDAKFFSSLFGVDIYAHENSLASAQLSEWRSMFLSDFNDVDVVDLDD